MRIVKGIDKTNIESILNWSYPYFETLISEQSYDNIILSDTNWDISFMLLNDKDDILGVYLIGDCQLPIDIDDNDISTMIGVEGVLLIIDDSIRNQGWGNKLKDCPKDLGVDYIWGQQLKELNNLNDWLKRRTLVTETINTYITAEIF